MEDYLGSNLDTYNHPNSLNEPRIPGIFQYYSVAEDELAKGYAGLYGSAQETADAIAVAWEKITDQIGRCLLYTSPSPRDQRGSRMPSSA